MTTETNERVVQVNGIELCAETFGDQHDPAILLIAGGASSMDWWEAAFCRRLADGGRYVIRYDLRDTGRSVSYPPGEPGYTGDDLVDDAVGLLDTLGVTSTHVVGISMGGALAQVLAVRYPSRVDTLTLMSTSPGGPGGPDNPDLPAMSDELQAVFSESGAEPDWSDRESVIDYVVEGNRPFLGSVHADESITREIVGRMFDRTTNIASSMTNHWMLEGGDPVRPRLGEVNAPTLVLHGTEDPLFPIGHGEALADAIAGAELVRLEGLGHEMPPRQLWEVVVPAILGHTSDAR